MAANTAKLASVLAFSIPVLKPPPEDDAADKPINSSVPAPGGWGCASEQRFVSAGLRLEYPPMTSYFPVTLRGVRYCH